MQLNQSRHTKGPPLMKTRMLLILALLASLLLFTAEGPAFIAPERVPLPNLDTRTDKPQPEVAPSAEQGAAVVLLRSRLPEARVDFEPVTGAPKLVSAGEKFLTTR